MTNGFKIHHLKLPGIKVLWRTKLWQIKWPLLQNVMVETQSVRAAGMGVGGLFLIALERKKRIISGFYLLRAVYGQRTRVLL